MKLITSAKNHLKDNRGSQFTEYALLTAIAVTIGGLLLTAFMGVFSGDFGDRLSDRVSDFFSW